MYLQISFLNFRNNPSIIEDDQAINRGQKAGGSTCYQELDEDDATSYHVEYDELIGQKWEVRQ